MKLLILGLILLIVQLGSCNDTVKRIEEIHSRIGNNENIDLEQFLDLIVEFEKLKQELNGNITNQHDQLAKKIIDLEYALKLRLISLRSELSDKLDPASNIKFRTKLEELRSLVEKSDNNLHSNLRNLRIWHLASRLDYIHGLLSRGEESQNTGSSSQGSVEENRENSLTEEYRSLRDDILWAELKDSEQIIKKSTISSLLALMDVNQFYDILMRETKPRESIMVENIDSFFLALDKLNDNFISKIKERDPKVADKLDELRAIWLLRPNVSNCIGRYPVEYKKLKDKYNPNWNVQIYLNVLKTKQIEICKRHIESKIDSLIESDSEVDSALARFDNLILVNQNSGLEGAVFDEDSVSNERLGYCIMNYLEYQGCKVNREGPVMVNKLKEIDRYFSRYVGKNCQRLAPLAVHYKFVQIFLKDEQPKPEFDPLTMRMVKASNICRRAINTQGHDWFFSGWYNYRKYDLGIKDKIKKDESASFVFGYIENLIMAAPSLHRILGISEHLNLMPKYKEILNILNTPVTSFRRDRIDTLKRLILDFREYPTIYRALVDLYDNRIGNIVPRLSSYLDSLLANLKPEGLKILNELRMAHEKQELRKRKPSIENRIKEIRKGSSREAIEQLINKQEFEAKKRRTGETSSHQSHFQSGDDYRKLLEEVCAHIIFSDKFGNVMRYFWAIQANDSDPKLSHCNIDFMLNFMICKYITNQGNLSFSDGAGPSSGPQPEPQPPTQPPINPNQPIIIDLNS